MVSDKATKLPQASRRRARTSGILAAATLALLIAWATPSAAQEVTIPAGVTSQVALPASNTFTCTPPGSFSPNPTTWSISPNTVQVGGTITDMPPAGHVLSVTVPSDHNPSQSIIISWSGNTDCISYNGIITIHVSAADPPPTPTPQAPQPTPGAGGDPPLPFSGEPVDGYCRVTHKKREVVLWVRGLTCGEALAILEDRRKGGDCFSVAALKSSPTPLFICRAHGRVLVSPGRGRCRPVKHKGRTYDVYRQRVLCRYARATTLRILRKDRPYIYEFVSRREGRRWRCIRRAQAGAIFGACSKRVERRWIVFFPRS